MNLNWKKLIVDVLCQIFGEDFRPWFESLFKITAGPDVNDIIVVGDAPDVVHVKLQKWIMDQLTKVLGSNKIIFNVVSRFLPAIARQIADSVWDSFFVDAINAGTLPLFAALPVPVMAGPPVAPATAAEIAACKTAVGI